jgi:hypothetical protein
MYMGRTEWQQIVPHPQGVGQRYLKRVHTQYSLRMHARLDQTVVGP